MGAFRRLTFRLCLLVAANLAWGCSESVVAGEETDRDTHVAPGEDTFHPPGAPDTPIDPPGPDGHESEDVPEVPVADAVADTVADLAEPDGHETVDVHVPSPNALLTVITMTSGGGGGSGGGYRLRVSVGAPQPYGIASGDGHRLIIGPLLPAPAQ